MKRELKDLKFSKALFEPIQKVMWGKMNEADLQAYFDYVGISEEEFERPSFAYNGDQFVRSHRWLVKRFSATTTLHDWLKPFTATSLGIASMAAMSSSSVSKILNLIVQFLPLYMPAMEATIEEDEGSTKIRFEYVADLDDVSDMIMEFTVGVLNSIGRELLGDELEWQANFRHKKRAYGDRSSLTIEEYEDLFGCEVVFNSSYDGLVGQTVSINTPIKQANQVTYEMAVELLQNELKQKSEVETFTSKTRTLLETHAKDDRYLSLEESAAEMNLTPRTFSRKLLRENMHFKALVNDVRFTRAKDMLKYTDKPLKQIAMKAGFQNGEAFSRAFKTHFGETPSQWRDNNRG